MKFTKYKVKHKTNNKKNIYIYNVLRRSFQK